MRSAQRWMRFGHSGIVVSVLGAAPIAMVTRVAKVAKFAMAVMLAMAAMLSMLSTVGCASGGTDKAERNDAQRYLRLGQMQYEQGNTSQAIDSMLKAIDQDPKAVEVYNFLGLIYLTNSEFDKAIEQFENAVNVDPYFTDARNNLGIALRQSGQLDRAEDEFKAALRDGNYRSPEKIYLNLGHLYLDQGRAREAIESFRRAVEIQPEYLLGLMGLGQAYADAGRVDLAEKAYGKVVRIAPESPEAERARQMIAGQAKQEDR